MTLVSIITIYVTMIEVYRLISIFSKNQKKLSETIFNIFLTIIMILINIYNFDFISDYPLLTNLNIMLIIIVILMIILDIVGNRRHLNTISIKKSIDLSDNGIMFLNRFGKILLSNMAMDNILNDLNITNDYINNIKKQRVKKINDNYIIYSCNKVWQTVINNNEVVFLDITREYKLQENLDKQNKKVKKNNELILESLNNIELLEKEKNLLKLKYKFHDLLGHRLTLLLKSLDNENVDDLKIIIDNLFEELDASKDSKENLKDLINIYKVFGIEINTIGNLPLNDNISNILFEIIREAVTNAIIHANSNSIKIIITESLSKIEMIIENDGLKPQEFIKEKDGIEGMRMKLKEINGSLTITTKDKYILKVTI